MDTIFDPLPGKAFASDCFSHKLHGRKLAVIKMKNENDPGSEQPQAEENRFIPLPSLSARLYAELVKGLLDERRIPCYIRSVGVSDVLRTPGTIAAGEIFVVVPENRYDECLAIQRSILDSH